MPAVRQLLLVPGFATRFGRHRSWPRRRTRLALPALGVTIRRISEHDATGGVTVAAAEQWYR